METTKIKELSITGESTGDTYNGSFTFNVTTTLRIESASDLRRRQIIGPCPDGTPPSNLLQSKAFMIGEIDSRLIEEPDFWKNGGGGMDIPDANVTLEVYNALLEAMSEYREEISERSKVALEKLAKKDSKGK